MSPNQLQFHAKREANGTNHSLINNPSSNSSISPFKINKDSHAIRKSSNSPSSISSSSSSSTSSLVAGGPGATTTTSTTRQQRHPVIIYTHSPKIIHTNPNDFMALVQKLTGLSRSEEDDPKNIKQENQDKTDSRSTGGGVSEDNESTSVVMDENIGSNNKNNNNLGDGGQVNSCYANPNPNLNLNPNIFYPQNSPLFFNQNSADFCGSSVHHQHQQLYNYNPEAMYLMPGNGNGNGNGNGMRSSYSSSTSLEAMKDLPDF